MYVVAAGILCGVAASLVLTRLMGSLLYGDGDRSLHVRCGVPGMAAARGGLLCPP